MIANPNKERIQKLSFQPHGMRAGVPDDKDEKPEQGEQGMVPILPTPGYVCLHLTHPHPCRIVLG